MAPAVTSHWSQGTAASRTKARAARDGVGWRRGDERVHLEKRWELPGVTLPLPSKARDARAHACAHTHLPQAWEKREGMSTNTRAGPAQHGYHGSRSQPDCALSSCLPVCVKITIPASQERTPRCSKGKGAAQTHGLAVGRLATWRKMLWVQICAFQVGTPPRPRAGAVRFPTGERQP